jgi:DNA-binding CsgD family transcriptional regulator
MPSTPRARGTPHSRNARASKPSRKPLASKSRPRSKASIAQPFTPANLTTLTSALASAANVSSDPLTRVLSVLTEVFDMLGSIGGSITQFGIDEHGSFAMLKLIELGRWTSKQRAARDAYWRQPHNDTDPFLAAYLKTDLFTSPRCAIRHELISDHSWYSSQHVKQFRKAAGMDSAIYCTLPAPSRKSSTGKSLPTGWSVNVNRPWKATPFTIQERDFLHAVFVGLLPWLSQVWSEPQSDSQRRIASVPVRLRKVLACLLAGRSEKQTAAALRLSPHTVHTYVKKLHKHFQVSSRAELLLKVSAMQGQSPASSSIPTSP